MKVILLDIRYWNDEQTLLGEEQWKWFEEELRTSTAEINVIGSSIQVLFASYHSFRFLYSIYKIPNN